MANRVRDRDRDKTSAATSERKAPRKIPTAIVVIDRRSAAREQEAKRFHEETRETTLLNAIGAMEKQSGKTLRESTLMLAATQCDVGIDMRVILAGVARSLGVDRNKAPVPAAELPQEILGLSWRDIIANRVESEGYSFNELGKAIHLSPSVVMRFAGGQRDIRLDTAEKICEELDLVLVPREWLPKAG
jgi:hypothetical protein